MRTVRTMKPSDVGPNATIEESGKKPIIPILEYRRLLNDEESADEQILERLSYLENFFRTIIRIELEDYANKAKS